MYKSLETKDFDLYTLSALKDNFSYLLVCKPSNKTLVIDPSESKPVFEALKKLGLYLHVIINTHHHPDHTGGNAELKQTFVCKVYGPEKESHLIPSLDLTLQDGQLFEFENTSFNIMEVPGHTLGHIALFEKRHNILFSGDVLFCFGCGRVFEGTHTMMNESLKKLSQLPEQTMVFCGHEYALQNLEFALQLEPQNQLITDHLKMMTERLKKGMPSVPTFLKDELKTNPFLKAPSNEAFSKIRTLKDQFKSSTTRF